ncbi:sigma 54-interacting transcriptional regulator [Bacillus alkalicola]|uniref:Sigma 54-interacting transcriptional regulator n=1 Tax=Evansella alkalicola TaxID=745819 RepID=A0ABS6JNB6_9BACI|nr:sigma 54-interacting transcriptional regulator [Bacillus alkalicola]
MSLFATDMDTKVMLKAILSSIDEGIHVIDNKGKTIYYNDIAADNDGLTVDEVVGRPLLDVFPSLSQQTSTMIKVIETGKPIFNQQQTYRNLRGKLIDTVNTTIPIIVQEKIIGAVEIAKDYSRIKELSHKLLDLQTKIDHRKEKALTIDDKQATYRFEDILTNDTAMYELINKAKKIAETSSPVFVYGETGTGKELLVQGIHQASPRTQGPFISQNCAAIPPTLLESMIFGTSKGSFTGSDNREGLFELAHGGTLFLDEIHTLPYDLQAKLLRVLEDGVIRRVGATNSVKTDVRVIVATNEDPIQLLDKGTLRKDLYYRLNVVQLTLPPLRKRLGDIEDLVHHFILNYNHSFNKSVKGISPEALSILKNYDWPGNIRELQHTIEAAMNVVEGPTMIHKRYLPKVILEHTKERNHNNLENKNSSFFNQDDIDKSHSLKEMIELIEKRLIEEILHKVEGNIQQAAKHLKIPRQTLQYKVQKYELK